MKRFKKAKSSFGGAKQKIISCVAPAGRAPAKDNLLGLPNPWRKTIGARYAKLMIFCFVELKLQLNRLI